MPRPVTIALDTLAVVLFVLAGFAAQEGFVLDLLGAGVSFRTPQRSLIWLVVIVALRLALDRRTGPFGISRERLLRDDAREAPPQADTRAAVRRAVLASLGFGALIAVLLHQQLRQPYAVPDYGDPLFSIWRVSWVLHALVTSPGELFNAPIFHPEPLALTFSDPMLLNAVMASPFAAVGVHPVVIYTVLLFLAFWLSGIATYLLVAHLTGSPRAAFVAGLIYATAAFRFDHYSHLELQMTHWMPLALLALHRYLATGRWPYLAAVGLAGVSQLYSAMYYAVFFVVYVAAVGAVLAVMRGVSVRRAWLPVALTVLGAAVLAAPLARPFLAAQAAKGERPEAEVRYYSARPADYARANSNSAIWQGRLLPPEPERALFPGAAPVALAAAGLVPPFGLAQAAYAAGLLVSVDGTLGFNGASYPLLFRAFEVVRGLRVPARFIALVALSLAVLAGFGARRLIERRGTERVRMLVFGALVTAVMIDAWPSLTLREVWREPPGIYDALRETPGAVVAEFPVMPDAVFNLPYMYFSRWHWTPAVNGYSGFIPESYHQLEPDLLAFPTGASVDALSRRGVTHVTISCGLRYARCRELQREMAASPELTLVAEAEWEGWPSRLYALRDP